MTRVFSPLVVAAVLVALAPKAPAQTFAFAKVEFEFDKDLDFSQLKTYGWAPLYSPARNPANHVNVKWHVERGLEKKGLRRAPEGEKPDVEVRYSVQSERRLRGTRGSESTSHAGGASDVRTTVDFDRVDEGVFSLGLVLPGTERAVWQAETDYRIADRKKVEQESRKVVASLLAKYPPPPAAPKP